MEKNTIEKRINKKAENREKVEKKTMENIGKTILKYVLTFVGAVVIGLALLFLVSLIPQSLLDSNAYKGREEVLDKDLTYFKLTEQDNYSTYIDNAADNTMVQLSYELGTKESSVINPIAYRPMLGDEAIYYGRYWHGYMALLRPALIFFSIDGLRRLFGTIAIALLGLLTILLVRNKQYALAVSILLSLSLVHIEVMVQCLEYVFCLIFTLAASIFMLCKKNLSIEQKYMAFFITGIVIAYTDFLTYETLAFMLPMIVCLLVDNRYRLKNVIISGITWVTGYISMFLIKWAMVSASGMNMLSNEAKLSEKFSVDGYTPLEALDFNLKAPRFINNYPMWAIGLLLAVCIAYILGKEYSRNYLILLVSLIPLLRFTVLTGHSGAHWVFTYHLLAGTLTGLLVIILSPFQAVLDKCKVSVSSKRGRLLCTK